MAEERNLDEVFGEVLRGVLREVLREISSPELRVVRVSEFMDGVLLVLRPWLWRKIRRDLWGLMASLRVRDVGSVLGMRGNQRLWLLM